MTDNGAAMQAEEFQAGLHSLGILHESTLPYSPYQNAKQETFWATLEGRLMAMLEGQQALTLDHLNLLTQAWVEQGYHRRRHVGRAHRAGVCDRLIDTTSPKHKSRFSSKPCPIKTSMKSGILFSYRP